jgi:hypothetical protein
MESCIDDLCAQGGFDRWQFRYENALAEGKESVTGQRLESGVGLRKTLEAVKDPRYDGFLRKARPVEELMEWIKYLTTPEGERPKIPPGPMPLKAKKTPDSSRGGTRGHTGTRYY